MGKYGLTLGQKWPNFGAKRAQLQKPAIHSKQLPVKCPKNNTAYRIAVDTSISPCLTARIFSGDFSLQFNVQWSQSGNFGWPGKPYMIICKLKVGCPTYGSDDCWCEENGLHVCPFVLEVFCLHINTRLGRGGDSRFVGGQSPLQLLNHSQSFLADRDLKL